MQIVVLCITLATIALCIYLLYCWYMERIEKTDELLLQLNTNRKLSVVNVRGSRPVFEIEGYFTTNIIKDEQLLLILYLDEYNHKHSCEIHLCPELFYVIEEVEKS